MSISWWLFFDPRDVDGFGSRNVFFSYDDEGPMILKDISCKIALTSRVGMVGANGAGPMRFGRNCFSRVPCRFPLRERTQSG